MDREDGNWKRLSDHENRIRDLEARRDPMGARLVEELRQAQKELRDIELEGTRTSQELVRWRGKHEEAHEADEEARTAERRSVKLMVFSALTAGAVSIGASLILWVITHGR